MNFSFYMFGTPNGSKNGYMQYPNDSTAQKFQEFALHATGEAQLTVWRKEQLSYYVYVRQL
ncbi:MAG: hypothetical protein LBU90_09315, partial [Bacteroidales bacterium]|nr:hypothetical protein [Bacteroidales bacterium]